MIHGAQEGSASSTWIPDTNNTDKNIKGTLETCDETRCQGRVSLPGYPIPTTEYPGGYLGTILYQSENI